MAFIPSKLPVLSLEAILETISNLTINIQQGQPLGEILQGAIANAQKLLPADRVLIYRILENQEPVVAFEAISKSCFATLGQRIYQACSPTTWLAPAQKGQLAILSSLSQETLPPDYIEQIERLQVKAQVSVPIFNQGTLWGLLIAHDCHSSRNWVDLEVQYLQQLALHLGVAVQQATLQQLNRHLRAELQQRPVVDVTHHSEAEAALQEREYYYAQILNSVQEMVFCKAPGSIVTYANQAACNYYGMTVEQLRGITDVPFNQLDFTQQYIQDDLQVFTTGEVVNRLEEPNQRPDGEVRYFHTIKSPIFDAHGNISQIVGVSRDITERKQTESALREQQRFTEQIAESTLAILYVYDLTEQRNIYCNHQIETVLGYSPGEIEAMGNALFPQLVHPDDLSQVLNNYQQFCCLADGEFSEIEYRVRHKAGNYRWLLARDKILKRSPEGKPQQIVGVAVDVTELKETQAILHQQTERERLLMAIAQNIRQTLDLEQILHTAVAEVRQFLQSDRVVIYRFEADGSSIIVAESVAEGWRSVLGMQSAATFMIETLERNQLDGQVIPIDNIYTASLNADDIERLEQMQVQAELMVPILQNSHLWGLLAAHHCQQSRHWEPFEIALQQQLATQLAIAIQQSELYQRVQSLNSGLELQVQERTAQLQQSLEFEALLRRITDRVRDSLDEGQILQAVVDELAQGLNLAGCDTGIYNSAQTTSTIAYESVSLLAPAKGLTFEIATAGHPEVYPYLLNGQSCLFCNLGRNPLHLCYQVMSILAVPIFDDQGVLGDLWLFKISHEVFDEQEVRLVQQVANHCAIALRQSRLYQASQAQVQELERLSQLKDDFLSTVSHELRSPMSNIKMATQMLEISLERLGILSDTSQPIHRYFNILREEGQREINLINDLLDLARFEAGMDDLELTEVNLHLYLPQLANTFAERMQQQQQQFLLQLPPNLPSLTTDLSHLERILVELLHNACKYTPAGETIILSAHPSSDGVEILVSNSGVEIPEVECDRIFDKFYRIPNNDPWKHKGTGLGLALVKKLVEYMGGSITVTSANNQTRFTVQLPQ